MYRSEMLRNEKFESIFNAEVFYEEMSYNY